MQRLHQLQRGSAALALVGLLIVGGVAYAGIDKKPEPATANQPASAVQRLTHAWAETSGSLRVNLTARQTELIISVDDMQLELTSERPGYLTLLAAGSDGSSLYPLLPAKGQTLRVAVGKTALPPPDIRIGASGPAGIGAVMAIVSDYPQDAEALLAQIKQGGRLEISGAHGVSVLLYREREQR
jgi:hypothetical protein